MQPLQEGSQPQGIAIEIDGVSMGMSYSPLQAHDVVLIAIRFDGIFEMKPDCAESMLEANFAMALNPQGAKFCRHPFTGDLLLQFAYPMAEANARQCLLQMLAMAAYGQQWKASLTLAASGQMASAPE